MTDDAIPLDRAHRALPGDPAPEHLLLQTEATMRAVETYAAFLASRFETARLGGPSAKRRAALPPEQLVRLTATGDAMLDATRHMFALIEPEMARNAERFVQLSRTRVLGPPPTRRDDV